jgi:hypothetical protein
MKSGGGVAFLNLGRVKGLFRITGTPKGQTRVRMLYDLSRAQVKSKPRPTLADTLAIMHPRSAAICLAALRREFGKHGIPIPP